MTERLNYTLTESIITLLCHDDVHGKIIAHRVDPSLFEGDYRVIAEKAMEYWKLYGHAPKTHTDDLISKILNDPNNRRAATYRRILAAMLELSDSINPVYVMDRLNAFNRLQRLKAGILKSAEQLQARQDLAISEVETIWNGLLRREEPNFDGGLQLTDIEPVLAALESKHAEFLTGIEPLDKARIVPERNTVFLVVAPAKRGKTWFLIEIGKQALLLRKNILHISLEVDAEDIIQRYWQNLFGIAKYKDESYPITSLRTDKDGYVEQFKFGSIVPAFTFQSPLIRDELESHINWLGGKSKYLRVKRFPTRRVNMDDIRSYLDNLEVFNKFMPDMTIIDYPGLFRTDVRTHRLDLGRQFEEFRGLCVERNMAGVAAHQGTRKTIGTGQTGVEDVAEDISVIQTTDKAVTYSQTKAEERFGLARLSVMARNERAAFQVLITQNYALGQFCVDWAYMNSQYEDLVKKIDQDQEEAED